MKKISIPFFVLIFQNHFGFGQIVYFENFGTGCTSGTLATTFGWTNTNTGVNSPTYANTWYVSSKENGVGPGGCGVGCVGTLSRTLHVGPSAGGGGDVGAAYLESSPGLCGFICSITNKRIQSPTINCTGISTIPFTFDYIENGVGLTDNATVWYSADNGATWAQIDDPPKSTLCGAQGLWATRSLTLPASADNNAAIKIGFLWTNNSDGTGTDPSIAIDNIQVGVAITPVEMVAMDVSCQPYGHTISWTTKSELNADYYGIYKSEDGNEWRLMTKLTANNTSSTSEYSVEDTDRSTGITYYYIEQVDLDGNRKTYSILSSEKCEPVSGITIYPNPSDGNELTITSSEDRITSVEVFSMDGKLIYSFSYEDDAHMEQVKIYPTLVPGSYLIRVLTPIGAEVISHIVQ